MEVKLTLGICNLEKGFNEGNMVKIDQGGGSNTFFYILFFIFPFWGHADRRKNYM